MLQKKLKIEKWKPLIQRATLSIFFKDINIEAPARICGLKHYKEHGRARLFIGGTYRAQQTRAQALLLHI